MTSFHSISAPIAWACAGIIKWRRLFIFSSNCMSFKRRREAEPCMLATRRTSSVTAGFFTSADVYWKPILVRQSHMPFFLSAATPIKVFGCFRCWCSILCTNIPLFPNSYLICFWSCQSPWFNIMGCKNKSNRAIQICSVSLQLDPCAYRALHRQSSVASFPSSRFLPLPSLPRHLNLLLKSSFIKTMGNDEKGMKQTSMISPQISTFRSSTSVGPVLAGSALSVSGFDRCWRTVSSMSLHVAVLGTVTTGGGGLVDTLTGGA